MIEMLPEDQPDWGLHCRPYIRSFFSGSAVCFDMSVLILKVNGYFFRGSNSTIVIFVSSHSWGQHKKEFAPRKQTHSRVDPILGRLCSPEKQTGSQKLPPHLPPPTPLQNW